LPKRPGYSRLFLHRNVSHRVWMAGFEPATSEFQARPSTWLMLHPVGKPCRNRTHAERVGSSRATITPRECEWCRATIQPPHHSVQYRGCCLSWGRTKVFWVRARCAAITPRDKECAIRFDPRPAALAGSADNLRTYPWGESNTLRPSS
jgi:hypothetical protein